MKAPALASGTRNLWYISEARYGRLGLLGFALLGCALILTLTVLVPSWKKKQDLQKELVALAKSPIKSTRVVSAPEVPQRYESHLPSPTEMTAIIGDIVDQARDQNLPVRSAEYAWTPATESSLAQYEMAFTLHAGYVPIRAFVQTLMNEQPALGLREFSFSRDSAGRPDLTARLRFVLFVDQ